MTTPAIEPIERDDSHFHIAYQLPDLALLEQSSLSLPNHYDIFLAYTPETIPIGLALDKAISEKGFIPWQGDLEMLLNSTLADEPYRGICQSDAFALIVGAATEVPPDLEDELGQALALKKLVFIIADQPLKSENLERLGLNKLTWLTADIGGKNRFENLTLIMVSGLTYVRLLSRATEWQKYGHNAKYLLSLGDIEASLERVNWLKKHPDLGLAITPAQEQFLEASQKQAQQRTDYFQGQTPDIFISYSSKDRDFVKELGLALKLAELGIWVDHDNIPIATNWKREVAEGIRAAHTFIFVISTHSLSSEHCGWELHQARRHGRRIIPICINHDFAQESLRQAGLSAINYISFERQPFPDAAQQLVKAIGTDLHDVKIYNRLYSRAYDWSNHGKQVQLLLNQRQYAEFKAWQKDRQKTSTKTATLQDLQPLQTEYMRASQNALSHDLAIRRSFAVFFVAFILAAAGSSYGFISAKLGEIQALVASLNDKAGLDGVITALRAARSLERNFLLGQINSNLQLEATTALHQETLIARELNRLQGHDRAAYGVAFSPGAEHIISTGQDKTVQVWNYSSALRPPLTGHNNEVLAVEYSSDGDFFVSSDADGMVNLWSCKPDVLARQGINPEGHSESSLSMSGEHCQWIKALPDSPSSRVVRVAISPGSQYIAAASFDGDVRLWQRDLSADFFRIPERLSHAGIPVFGLDFNPKQRAIVSADVEGIVKVWSLENNEELASINVGRRVYDTRFSHDGQLVAVGGENGLLKLWNWETDQVVDLPGHREGFVHVLFHPFERRLISADTEGIINLWQPEDLSEFLTTGNVGDDDEIFKPISLLGHQGGITRIRFSADGSYLASASDDDTIRLWLTEDGTLLDVMRGHDDEVLNLAFSPERGGQYGKTYLASSSRDGSIRLWQINNDVRPLKHDNRLYDIAFHPEGKILASSGRSRISLWRLWDYKLLGRVGREGDIFSVHYSPNGDFLASGDSTGKITLWKHPVHQYQSSRSEANSAVEDEQAPYKEWLHTDEADGENAPLDEVAVVRFHPSSEVIASGGADGVVRFWNTEGGLLGQRNVGDIDDGITSLDFSKDGKYLAVSTRSKLAENATVEGDGFEDSHLEVFRIEIANSFAQVNLENSATISGKTDKNFHRGGVLTVAFNPTDSGEFASGGEDGHIKIWDIDGRFLSDLEGHDYDGEALNKGAKRITRVDYSHSGRMLVSSGEDGTVKFWNVVTARMISSLKRHERQVAKVIFNPEDPTMLASAGFDSQVLIWTIPQDFEAGPLQKLVIRGCLSADKYLDLAQDNSDKLLKKDEQSIRQYCRKKLGEASSIEERRPN